MEHQPQRLSSPTAQRGVLRMEACDSKALLCHLPPKPGDPMSAARKGLISSARNNYDPEAKPLRLQHDPAGTPKHLFSMDHLGPGDQSQPGQPSLGTQRLLKESPVQNISKSTLFVSMCFTFYLQSWCFNEWLDPEHRCFSVKISVGPANRTPGKRQAAFRD